MQIEKRFLTPPPHPKKKKSKIKLCLNFTLLQLKYKLLSTLKFKINNSNDTLFQFKHITIKYFHVMWKLRDTNKKRQE